jgi:hypothetical protein
VIEPPPPTHRGLRRQLYQRRTWWARVLILLSAILVLVAPLSAAGQAPQPASISGPSAPRISFQKLYVDGTGRGEILTASADGRGGVRQLVPGMHNHDFCQSADGRKIAYYSDQETPHENLPYVADADGANAQKIHGEPSGEVVCPFSERWLLLGKCCGGCRGPWAIVRHDLQTGAEETVATNVDERLSLSPDGNKLLFVGGLDYTVVPGRACPAGRETLYLLDLTTLERRRLAGPLARGKSYGIACFGNELLDARHCAGSWSPDGSRIAYTIGPSIYADIPTAGEPPVLSRARPYAVYVRPQRVVQRVGCSASPAARRRSLGRPTVEGCSSVPQTADDQARQTPRDAAGVVTPRSPASSCSSTSRAVRCGVWRAGRSSCSRSGRPRAVPTPTRRRQRSTLPDRTAPDGFSPQPRSRLGPVGAGWAGRLTVSTSGSAAVEAVSPSSTPRPGRSASSSGSARASSRSVRRDGGGRRASQSVRAANREGETV